MGFFDYVTEMLSFGELQAEAQKEEKEEENEQEEETKDAGKEDDKEEEGGDDEEAAEEEEEEEEEDEPVDPKGALEEECAKSKECAPHKHHYDHCVERVTKQQEENDGKADEDCVEEFFHLAHCASACAAPKLFKMLK